MLRNTITTRQPDLLNKEEILAKYPMLLKEEENIQKYVDGIMQYNAHTNLVGKSTLANPWSRHILDSFQLASFIKNKNVIALLSKEFRLHYDEIGMLKTKLFPGVYNGLKDLSSSKRLYISTNKPKKVSLTILDNLGIRSFFSSVYATNIGKYKEKKDIVEEILVKNVGSRGTVAGDSLDDYKSALSNGIDFVYCSYGYGKIDDDVKCVHDAKELFSYLKYA